MQPADFVAQSLKHLADLTVLSFMKDDFQSVCLVPVIGLQQSDLRRCCDIVFHFHALFESDDLLTRYHSVYVSQIGLFHFEGRMDQFLHQLTVVAQKDETGGIIIQSAHRIKPVWGIHKIDDRLSSPVIAGRRDDIFGFVQKEDDLFFPCQKHSIDLDLVLLIRFETQLRDKLSVDFDLSLQDQFLGFSSGTIAASCNDLLKSLHNLFLSL